MIENGNFIELIKTALSEIEPCLFKVKTTCRYPSD